MRAPKPQSPAANKLGKLNPVIQEICLSHDKTSLAKSQFRKPFYSAESGLGFSSFIWKLEKNNPENPVNSVKKKVINLIEGKK